MIKTVIINDRYGIAAKMGEKIAGMVGEDINVEVLPSIETAKKWFEIHPEPDIVLMDIHAGGEVNLDFFRYLKSDCPIVFTTEHEYVICAYKIRPGNYLLNAHDDAYHRKELDNCHNTVNHRHYLAKNLTQIMAGLIEKPAPLSAYKEKFIVNVKNNWIPVDTKDIACFTRKHLNYLYTFSGEKYILDYATLEDIEKLLDPKLFYRTNRQSIIHINAIRSVKPLGNQKLSVVLKDPVKVDIDISREKAPAFKKWFDR